LKTAVLTLKLRRLQKEDQILGLGLNHSLLALPFLVSLQPPSVSFDLIANCNNVQSCDLYHCNMLIHGFHLSKVDIAVDMGQESLDNTGQETFTDISWNVRRESDPFNGRNRAL